MRTLIAIAFLAFACGTDEADLVETTDSNEQPLIAKGCERPYICDNPHIERNGCNVAAALRYWGCYTQCEPCEETDP